MNDLSDLKLVRTAFSVTTFAEADQKDREFWWNKTPLERLEWVEQLRRMNFGYDDFSGRLLRVLEVTQRK